MKELKVLKKCLLSAGKVLTSYFGKTSYSLKGHANLVTEADLKSQDAILAIMRREFPGHDYMAEENCRKILGSDCLWVIDPLDGTTNYAHGFPAACVSIGMLKKGEPCVGGVFDPFRKELFMAAKGRGTVLNDRKVRVSSTPSLGKSLLLTGFPYDRAGKAAFYCSFYSDFLEICHDIRRSGSAALDLAWTAAGRADGYWEFNLKPWDVSAGMLLVEEAGGKVTDFEGKKWKNAADYGRQTLASNGKIHGQVLKIIQKRLERNRRRGYQR